MVESNLFFIFIYFKSILYTMRLLRLTTDNTKALFDNNFNTDIKIEKGEQIALQSCSFSEQISVLKVDGTNNKLSFKYS